MSLDEDKIRQIMQRNIEMHQLRKDGLTYREIGAKFGISHETVRVAIVNHKRRLKVISDGKLEPTKRTSILKDMISS